MQKDHGLALRVPRLFPVEGVHGRDLCGVFGGLRAGVYLFFFPLVCVCVILVVVSVCAFRAGVSVKV